MTRWSTVHRASSNTLRNSAFPKSIRKVYGHVDDEDDEELVISEAIEQALKTRSRGILKHIACLSPEAYSDVKELRVWSSTFNVNGDKPQPDQDFRSWLVHPGDVLLLPSECHECLTIRAVWDETY